MATKIILLTVQTEISNYELEAWINAAVSETLEKDHHRQELKLVAVHVQKIPEEKPDE